MTQARFLALTAEQADQLLLQAGDDAAVQVLLEGVADERGAEWAADAGDWEALDACLAQSALGKDTDGARVSLAVRGGRRINEGTQSLQSYLDPAQVRRCSKVLMGYTRRQFDGHFDVCERAGFTTTDRESLWSVVQDVAFVFIRAAAVSEAVVFSANR